MSVIQEKGLSDYLFLYRFGTYAYDYIINFEKEIVHNAVLEMLNSGAEKVNIDYNNIEKSKELSKGLSETAATIFKLIYADNYITRGDIAKKIGISVTAVQKHINKLKSLRFIDRDGSTGHGNWRVIK